MEFDELFREVRASAARLGADADSLTDRQAREPSRLPGWSRGHVLTHLARSADAYRWMLALARTGTAPGPRADAAELERQLGGDASGCSLRVGVFGAEPWTQAMRKEIERRLGITALDIYGLSEVMGPGVAMECLETTDGPTIWEDHFYPEIVNPHDGTPLADGEHGELLFTTLTKEALPVIRYRTRDLTRLLPGTARTMRRMDRISGRSDDMLIIRGVNVFPSQLEEEIVKFEHLSPHYQLEVNRRGHLDSLSVKVELKESSLTLTHEQRCQVCHQLRHRIKSMVGISTDVMIVNCGSIPRSEGKACRVFDLRNIVGA